MKKTISIICLILVFFFIYFLQSNFFTWFTIAGVMPNIFIILVLFMGLFMKKKIGMILGLIFGLYLDIILGKTVGISGILFALIGLMGEILSKSFSKDSKITVIIMVIVATAFYESIKYIFNMLITEGAVEALAFAKILLIEIIFNTLITIIIFPIIKKSGYYLDDLFEDKKILTRYF